ncbi:MAG: hypothetical protein HW410_1278 [Nitrosarchaeum sp.]|nr:hypothetical protein [Nitrosarchaeum sp.]
MIKRVYLDTNHWIKLAQIASGKENDHEYKKTFEKIKSLSDSEKIIFPISASHVHELTRHSNQQKREEIIDLLVDISKGWFLQPVDLFFGKEIENTIMHRLKRNSLHNIHNEILKKGLSYFCGMNFDKFIKTKNPPLEWMDVIRTSFKDFNENLEVIKRNLKDPKIVEISIDALSVNHKLILLLEKNRENKRKMDKDVRKRFSEASIMIDCVVPHMAEFLYTNQIPAEDVFSLQTVEEMRSFMDDMPALNVFFRLTYARDEVSPQRKIQPSDIWDLNHFAGAIPYCDVLVTEKMFAGLSKQNNLDKKYNCIILTDLKDLRRLEPFS